jgi:hypothetical protein
LDLLHQLTHSNDSTVAGHGVQQALVPTGVRPPQPQLYPIRSPDNRDVAVARVEGFLTQGCHKVLDEGSWEQMVGLSLATRSMHEGMDTRYRLLRGTIRVHMLLLMRAKRAAQYMQVKSMFEEAVRQYQTDDQHAYARQDQEESKEQGARSKEQQVLGTRWRCRSSGTAECRKIRGCRGGAKDG